MDSHDDEDVPGARRRLDARDFDPALERLLLEAGIFVEQAQLKMRLIPGGWLHFESVPVRPPKAKTTVAFDADLVEWFRAMGAGYQARMNHVLRVFMLAVLSKEIHTERDYDWRARLLTRRR